MQNIKSSMYELVTYKGPESKVTCYMDENIFFILRHKSTNYTMLNFIFKEFVKVKHI